MAERRTEPPAGQPYNRGREDTVVRPMPTAEQLNGDTRADAKVLPPMPTNGQSAGKTASRSSKPTQPPATRTSSAAVDSATTETTVPTGRKPSTKPTGPPPQARTSASPAVQPAPTTRPTPVAPVAPTPDNRATPEPKRARTKVEKPPKPAKPSRQDKHATKAAAAPRPGRRARLRMTRIDPWSVMKTSFLLSIALGVVTVVSVLMVWSVLGAADVWSSINQTVQDVVGGQDASNFDIEDYIGTRRVVGFTIIVAAVDVVLLTAIATLGAFLYNMSASLLGGIEVTLAEDN
jgi:hypothetical protein